MVSKELKLVEIVESINNEIFNIDNPSELELKYLQREAGIKQTILLCFNQIIELAKAPGLDKLTDRQKIKSRNCFENLSLYTKELIAELDEVKIKKHIEEVEENKNSFKMGFSKPFEPDFMFLISNSFHTAITTEILWAKSLTLKQAIDISSGKQDLNELGTHLPKLIKNVERDVVSYLKQSKLYSEFTHSIVEAIGCYNKKLYRGCNLIVMTTIEGMVRKLSKFLAKFHDLGDDFSDNKYSSLSALLRNVKWKEDIEIDETSYSLLVGMNKTINHRREKGQDVINVDLNTRLDFLKGRFKDDRDLILHGTYSDYNKEWNLFLNFSALIETKSVCEYYDNKYGN